MDNSYSTISSHVKSGHLSYEDRILSQIPLKSRCSIRAIAREIGCAPSTVSNELVVLLRYIMAALPAIKHLSVSKPMRTTERTVAGIMSI